MDKNSLLASLTGGGGDGDQDLFGDVPVDGNEKEEEQVLPFAQPSEMPPVATVGIPAISSPASNTLLSKSGLLAEDSGEMNMFADVDREEKAATPSPAQTAPKPPMTFVHTAAAPIAAPPAPVTSAAPQPTSTLLSKSGLLGDAAAVTGGDDGGDLFADVDREEKEAAELEAKKQQEEAARVAEAERKAAEEEAARREAAEAEKRRQEEQARQDLWAQQQQQQQQQQSYAQQQFQNPMSMSMPYPPGNNMYGQQQQPSAMMQSMMATPNIAQNQLANQMQGMTLGQQQQPGGFYRSGMQGGPDVNNIRDSNVGLSGSPYGAPSQGQYMPHTPNNGQQNPGNPYVTSQQSYVQPQQPISSPQQQTPGSGGGIYVNGNAAAPGSAHLAATRKLVVTKPPEVTPRFSKISVTDPMLIQSPGFLLTAPPYWSYQITSNLGNNGGVWMVRRRFRHIVALEDRLRQSCLGSILPPRPDKHQGRIVEEASAQQSSEFAMQRRKEMEIYLNQLAKHPMAGHSHPLQLFLGLQDDIGTAWPEVSSNALTRLTAVGAGVSVKVAESTSNALGGNNPAAAAISSPQEWEDNAELLGLQSSENLRMGAVTQAVPKVEGLVALFRDHGEISGALGMELSKLTKVSDIEVAKASEILSNGMLRQGRRAKRLALELSAALEPFQMQYKLCRYERMAFGDRKIALQRKAKERRGADMRATQLMHQQRVGMGGNPYGGPGNPYGGGGPSLDHLERSAVLGDQVATQAAEDADSIATILKSEVNRVAYARQTEWQQSMKVLASAFKEASSENVAIWESTLEAFGGSNEDSNATMVGQAQQQPQL